jgi:hypothetical protein
MAGVEVETRQAEVMRALYGADLWHGFEPAYEAGAVLGWNGRHPVLTRLALQAAPPIVVDVGVWKGQSTITIAKALKDAGIDGCVIAVDTFLGSSEHWNGTGPNKAWEFSRRFGLPDLYDQFLSNVWHSGTATHVVPFPQTSTTAAELLRRRKLRTGLVHIDASHDYDDVARDIAAYWPLVAPGGYLLGDDYPWAGVKRAADEFAERVGQTLTLETTKWWVRKPAR